MKVKHIGSARLAEQAALRTCSPPLYPSILALRPQVHTTMPFYLGPGDPNSGLYGRPKDTSPTRYFPISSSSIGVKSGWKFYHLHVGKMRRLQCKTPNVGGFSKLQQLGEGQSGSNCGAVQLQSRYSHCLPWDRLCSNSLEIHLPRDSHRRRQAVWQPVHLCHYSG